MKNNRYFQLINEYYGDRVAERSKVPLINHIIEGLFILDHLKSSIHAQQAFCIHPIIQKDEDFKKNNRLLTTLDPYDVALAVEYRSVANEYLSDKFVNQDDKIRLSPLKDVNDMLKADKIQNYNDFLTYHSKTHPRALELNDYFINWLSVLGIYFEEFAWWGSELDKQKKILYGT